MYPIILVESGLIRKNSFSRCKIDYIVSETDRGGFLRSEQTALFCPSSSVFSRSYLHTKHFDHLILLRLIEASHLLLAARFLSPRIGRSNKSAPNHGNLYSGGGSLVARRVRDVVDEEQEQRKKKKEERASVR